MLLAVVLQESFDVRDCLSDWVDIVFKSIFHFSPEDLAFIYYLFWFTLFLYGWLIVLAYTIETAIMFNRAYNTLFTFFLVVGTHTHQHLHPDLLYLIPYDRLGLSSRWQK